MELERDLLGKLRGRASLNDSSGSGSAGTGSRLSHFGFGSDITEEAFLEETLRFGELLVGFVQSSTSSM